MSFWKKNKKKIMSGNVKAIAINHFIYQSENNPKGNMYVRIEFNYIPKVLKLRSKKLRLVIFIFSIPADNDVTFNPTVSFCNKI